ncbi:hypothetical protein EJ110_NYTH56065 [Nymphaea thermarum]|nr:hypothetical protein EJ110_NYTH56065 [Nymphaea thermarum]
MERRRMGDGRRRRRRMGDRPGRAWAGTRFSWARLYLALASTGTLRAGKLTEKVLKVFIATGNPHILSFIESLGIKIALTPILPTRCSEKF